MIRQNSVFTNTQGAYRGEAEANCCVLRQGGNFATTKEEYA